MVNKILIYKSNQFNKKKKELQNNTKKLMNNRLLQNQIKKIQKIKIKFLKI